MLLNGLFQSSTLMVIEFLQKFSRINYNIDEIIKEKKEFLVHLYALLNFCLSPTY